MKNQLGKKNSLGCYDYVNRQEEQLERLKLDRTEGEEVTLEQQIVPTSKRKKEQWMTF